jgi:acetylornithine deacetylase/succinyl-diaminopimelate desuccinylase-like protein
MKEALVREGGAALAAGMDLTFMYRHDSSVLDPSDPLPKAILRHSAAAGKALEVAGMTASCDAWFYNNQLGIPTVVCGPGSLKVAHSKDEMVEMKDIAQAAETMVRLALEYCA